MTIKGSQQEKLCHWINHATFGVTPELLKKISAAAATEPEQWKVYVTQQLALSHPKDEKVERKIKSLGFNTLEKSLTELWTDHFLEARKLRNMEKASGEESEKKVRDKKNKIVRDVALEPVRDLEMATWIRMVHSEWQIHERMVEFWHDHFNIFGHEQRHAAGLVALNRDVIRPQALGNFRQLLEQVCRNPALLYYLDNAQNQSGNPNENFARELFELHTLGAENYLGTRDRERVEKDTHGHVVGYVDGDVYEAARAFTGWRVADGSAGLNQNTGEFHYHEAWHDRFQKIVLGHKIQEHQAPLKDGNDVLDFLCAHPGTARHIVRKICRRFVSDNPPASLVSRLSEEWLKKKDSPAQIADVLRSLLLSEEFLSCQSTKFKRPVEYFVSLLRSLAPDFVPTEKFIQGSARSGHRLFGWKTPDGAPDTAPPWQSPQSLIDRWKFSQQILKNEIPECVIKFGFDGLSLSPESLAETLTVKLLCRIPKKSTVLTLTAMAAGGRRNTMALPSELVEERALLIAEILALSPLFQVKSHDEA